METKLDSTASDLTLLRDEIMKGTTIEDSDGAPSAVVVPDGYRLESIEHLEPTPWRQRATVAADTIAEFVGYVSEHADGASRVFVDPRQPEALAVLDYGTTAQPGWGQHRAHCKLRLDECYDDLLTLVSLTRPPEAVLDFVLDYFGACRFFSRPVDELLEGDAHDGEMPVQQAVQALRNIRTIISRDSANENADANRTRSTLERAAVTNKVPLTLIVHCQPAPELAERDISVRLRYQFEGDKPSIRLRILHRATREQEIAAEFRDTLRRALGEGDNGQEPLCPVHVGTLASFQ